MKRVQVLLSNLYTAGQPAVAAPSKQVLREVLSKNWKGSLGLVLKGGKEEGLG